MMRCVVLWLQLRIARRTYIGHLNYGPTDLGGEGFFFTTTEFVLRTTTKNEDRDRLNIITMVTRRRSK